MRQPRVLYIYTNTNVLRVTRRSGIAAFPCLQENGKRKRVTFQVSASKRAHLEKINGKPRVSKTKKIIEKLNQYLNKLQ